MNPAKDTGLVVHDFSGHRRLARGDGSPETQWSIIGGPSVESLIVAFSNLNIDDDVPGLLSENALTVVIHKEKTDAVNRNGAAFTAGTFTGLVRLFLPAADGIAYWDFGGTTGDHRVTASGLAYGSDLWVARAGSRGMHLWQNGQLVASNSVGVTRADTATSLDWNGNGSAGDLARTKILLIYDRELSEQEIQTLSRDPLAPFYLAPPAMLSPAGGEDVSSTLTLTDFAEVIVLIGDVHHLSHHLNLTDSAEGDNASVEGTSHSLNLTQSVTVLGPIRVTAHNRINFSDGVVAYLGVPWLPIEVTDILAFVQQAGRGLPRSATNVMTLTDEVYRSFQVEDALSLLQTISAGQGDDSEQSLNLSHSVVLNAIWRRSVTHDNFIRDGFTYYKDSKCARKRYSPFEGGDAAMPEKRLQFKSNFTLESLSGPYLSVVLRNPEMDNRDRLGFNRVNRETSGGELNVFVDPVWAKVNTLLFTIVAVKREKIAALQSFFQETLGHEVKLSDWSGAQWRGIITTPNETATEDSDGYWTVSFEFEGEPYEGQAPDDRLAFSQSVTVELVTAP
jgi:hypothetical protein